MEYLVAILLVLNIAATFAAPRLLQRRMPRLQAPDEVHDHEGHDAGTLAELRQIGKLSGGRIDLHDIETVMRRRRDRRRRETV